jgi:gas vesicle protein
VKTKKLLNAVEDGTQTAVEYLIPYVEQALRDGGEFADQAYSRVRPVLKDAGIRGARIAADTFERVHPVLDDALDKVSPAVDATVKVVKPAVEDVLQRIPPTVDFAREKVQADYLPRLAEALRDLASQPLARELKVAVASAALAKELEKASSPKKRSGWRTFGKLLLAGAVLGGVVVAIRKLLAEPSTGWETHTPKSAYVADPVADVAEQVKKKAAAAGEKAADVAKDVTEKVADTAEDVKDKAADVAKDAKEKVADAAKDASDQVAETTDDLKDKAAGAKDDIEDKLDQLADKAEGGDASPLAGSPYGDGSFVGDVPPEGFDIKGNDRSMKYHVPGSAAYERTIAEVWFDSEESAQAAGFVRAQR